MKKLTILALTILTILTSCNKDNVKPEDYKFYCKVDGLAWKWNDENHFCTGCLPIISEYYPNGSLIVPPKTFFIKAERIKGINQTIQLWVMSGLKVGYNSLPRSYIYIDDLDSCEFILGHLLDTTFSNTFFVSKIDTINRNKVGNFNLRAIDNQCAPPDTIRITEGHFDLNPVWHP